MSGVNHLERWWYRSLTLGMNLCIAAEIECLMTDHSSSTALDWRQQLSQCPCIEKELRPIESALEKSKTKWGVILGVHA